MIDPHPELEKSKAHSRLFGVLHAIPEMNIPLNDGDVLKFNFGIPYQKTFEEAFYGAEIDYSELPVNFETYSPVDQERIKQRMAEIAALREPE